MEYPTHNTPGNKDIDVMKQAYVNSENAMGHWTVMRGFHVKFANIYFQASFLNLDLPPFCRALKDCHSWINQNCFLDQTSSQ